jgi:ABC-type multidrug transport system fused ATPase/permease subunit
MKPIIVSHPMLTVVVVVFGGMAALFESASLGLVLPVLQGMGDGGHSQIPFPFSLITNYFIGMNLFQRIRIAAFLLVCLISLRAISLIIGSIAQNKLRVILIKYYRMACSSQLMKVGMEYINHQKSADLHTTITVRTNDLGALATYIGSLFPRVFSVSLLFAMLLILSWKLTLLSVFVAGLIALLLQIIANKAEIIGKRCNQSYLVFSRAALDMLQGMKLIRVLGREKDIIQKFDEKVEDVNQNLFKMGLLSQSVQPAHEVLSAIALAIILIAGSLFILSQNSGKGMEIIIAFIVIFNRITPSAMAFNQAWVSMKGDMPAYKQVADLLETKDKIYLSAGNQLPEKQWEAIEFRDVSFEYDLSVPVLSKISFKILRGSHVGFVGSSGGGKSTIVELLLRFYDPQAGSILVDRVPLKELDILAWRRKTGFVAQDTFLFHDTIKGNIAFANPEATEQEIQAAAKKAFCHEFIMRLPKGYDTVIGDRGVLLSGGQKQRIAIARAIISNPDILIFDEATSSLDTESEDIVQRALEEVGKDRTVITIAHRLSTVRACDPILVLDKGSVVQRGTHTRLAVEEGVYRKLMNMQVTYSNLVKPA